MSVRVMTAVWDTDLPATEKLVLLALADNANDEGHCWPSALTLARKCGQGERTVRRAIRSLEAGGHITQTQRNGTSPIYKVHPCRSGTPAAPAPLPERPETPAAPAPKPSRTINSSGDKSPSDKRPRGKPTFPAPAGVPEQIWIDFLASPKRRKAGMSPTAYTGIVSNLATLAEHGFPPGKMIALAVERGWVTVKLEWVKNDGQRNGTNSLGRHQSHDGLGPTASAAIDVFGPMEPRGTA